MFKHILIPTDGSTISSRAVKAGARAPQPCRGEAARRRDCDLIFMSSHGRTGLMRMALGSVADKVMTLSKVPVMVYR